MSDQVRRTRSNPSCHHDKTPLEKMILSVTMSQFVSNITSQSSPWGRRGFVSFKNVKFKDLCRRDWVCHFCVSNHHSNIFGHGSTFLVMVKKADSVEQVCKALLF